MDSTSTPPGPGAGPDAGPGAGPAAAPPGPTRDAQHGSDQGPPTGLSGFFDSMRRTGLVRPDESVRSGPGVCAAVANRLGIDVTLVRVGVVVLTLFGGFGLLAYALAWLLLPQVDGRTHAEDVLHGRFTSGGVGSLIAVFFGFGGFGRWWWEPGGGWGGLIALVTIAGVVAVVVWGIQRSPDGPAGEPRPPGPHPPGAGAQGAAAWAAAASGAGAGPGGTSAPTVDLGKGGPPVGLTKPVPAPTASAPPAATPPPPRPVRAPSSRRRPAGPASTALVAGLALAAAATVLLVDRVTSIGGHTGVLATGAAVVVIGLAVLLTGLAGRRAGGLTGLAVVALVLLGGGWADARAGGVLSDRTSADRTSRFDDRSWAPGTVRDGDSWGVEMGSGTLDLAGARTTGGEPPTLTVDVRLGSMQVEVSDEQTIELDFEVSQGSLEVPASTGVRNQDVRTTIGPDGPVDLRIEGSVRLGELVIQEGTR